MDSNRLTLGVFENLPACSMSVWPNQDPNCLTLYSKKLLLKKMKRTTVGKTFINVWTSSVKKKKNKIDCDPAVDCSASGKFKVRIVFEAY